VKYSISNTLGEEMYLDSEGWKFEKTGKTG
jgi:hypothetical protein